MTFFGYPWQIWAASFMAVMVKLSMASSAPTTWIARVSTIAVALFSGLILYLPVVEMLGLSASWHVPVAIIISLTAENVMKNIAEFSEDKEFFKEWIKDFLNKKDDAK
jgi:hypothetical protein